MAELDPTWFWAVSRAAGIAAYSALSLDVLFGLLMSTALADRWIPRARSLEVHRFLSVAGLSLTAVHAMALLGDRHVGFGPLELLVPFASSYRPAAVAFGVLAAWFALLVHASFALRRWLGARGWRAVHYLAFALFVLATAHGLLAGTDARFPWMRLFYAVVAAAVLWLTFFRVGQALGKKRILTKNVPVAHR